ncbi:MAG: 3-deoxy-manno-octulosonate cytidylyltransferase [Acidobacteriota bacterium]
MNPLERPSNAVSAEPRIVAVIPARMASERLPGKPLRDIAGKPLLRRVWEAAAAYDRWTRLVVATEDQEILDYCRTSGLDVEPTGRHASGTDRLCEIADRVAAEIYVNIQGDEPTLRWEHFDALLQPLLLGAAPVSTLSVALGEADAANPNTVKVVTDRAGRALYFSRHPIPYHRDGSEPGWFKHIGLYGYRRSALRWFRRLPPGVLERKERLEQLRFLENGIPIAVSLVQHDTIGVDTPEDLARAACWFSGSEDLAGA